MENYAISVRDLTKVYKLYNRSRDRLLESLGLTFGKKLSRDHYALKHVSFDVKRGETIGIIGTNGSGKSTILKIITGVVTPTSGEVVVDGRISALLELGAGFNMEYTGIENIYLNGTMIGFSKQEIRDCRIFWTLPISAISSISRSKPIRAVCLSAWLSRSPSTSIRRS